MMKKCVTIIGICVVIIWGSVTPVEANESADASAMAAFQKGSALFENNQFAAAAVQFRIAYKHKPSWKLYYNIAQCEAGAKRYGLALENFESYLVEAGDEIDAERRGEVEKETARMRTMVGFLNVTGPAGAHVIVDGTKRGTLPLTGLIPVTATKDHNVSGTLNNEKLSMMVIKVMTAQQAMVVLERIAVSRAALLPAPQPAPAVPEQPAPVQQEDEGPPPAEEAQGTSKVHPAEEDQAVPATKNKLKSVGLGLTIGGSAIFAGGLIVGGVGFLSGNKLSDKNPDGISGNQISDNNTWKAMATAGDIMMAVGGLVAATGIVLLIVNKKKGDSPQASLVPTPGGIMIEGSF